MAAQAGNDRSLTLTEITLLNVLARCGLEPVKWEAVKAESNADEADILIEAGWGWPAKDLAELGLLEISTDGLDATFGLTGRARQLLARPILLRRHRLMPRLRISELAAQ